jgi:hypothetical protein
MCLHSAREVHGRHDRARPSSDYLLHTIADAERQHAAVVNR